MEPNQRQLEALHRPDRRAEDDWDFPCSFFDRGP
jgi:hypothetical protein